MGDTYLLDLSDAPPDPIERLMWLSGVKAQVTTELDEAWAEAYYNARLTGRIDTAIALAYHGKTRVIEFTRKWNEHLGRGVRWTKP